MDNTCHYKRDTQRPLTITGVFNQLAEFAEDTGHPASSITFPPHEYYFLRYLCRTINPPQEPEEVLGIPIEIGFKKQDGDFLGIS